MFSANCKSDTRPRFVVIAAFSVITDSATALPLPASLLLQMVLREARKAAEL